MRYKVFDVFARAPLEGNPTGIVYYEGPEDTSLMQRLAAEFLFPIPCFSPERIVLLPSLRVEPSLHMKNSSFAHKGSSAKCMHYWKTDK
jgi:hypothetical protein